MDLWFLRVYVHVYGIHIQEQERRKEEIRKHTNIRVFSCPSHRYSRCNVHVCMHSNYTRCLTSRAPTDLPVNRRHDDGPNSNRKDGDLEIKLVPEESRDDAGQEQRHSVQVAVPGRLLLVRHEGYNEAGN